jgi:hypothetical protein
VSGLRDQARVIPTAAIPPQVSTDDVAEAVHWRDVWARALTHISQMPERDQMVLLAPLLDRGVTADGREPVRISVRRHRARGALRRRLGGALSVLVPSGLVWRVVRRQSLVVVSGTAAVAAAFIAVLGATAGQTPDRLTPRSQAPSVFVRIAHTGTPRDVSPHMATAVPRFVSPAARPRPHIDRRLVVQPTRSGPGARVDESRPRGPQPLICLHGPVVEGTCTPPLTTKP